MTKKNTTDINGFGNRLASFRRAAGYTQDELSNVIGVSRRMIAYYECETQHPPTTILPRLAQVLSVSVDELLNGNSPRKVLQHPLSGRLQRKLEALEKLNAKDQRQALQLLDTFIDHATSTETNKETIYPERGTKPDICVREVYHEDDIRIIEGDSRKALAGIPDNTFQCCVTSPPYWGLRDYGIDGQIGAENDPDAYIADLVGIFREVRRTLREDGTLWLNIGDSYTSGDRRWRAPDKKNPGRAMSYRAPTPKGLKPKDLIGVPWRLALALQADGWFLRSDIVWNKPNCQPESVKDRPTRAHEYVFLMSKSESYFYDYESIKEPSTNGNGPKNRRTVWNINTNGFHGAHFAVFPPGLVRLCIQAGSRHGGVILDPFFGSGTVGVVCRENQRRCVGIELNPEYVQIALKRINQAHPRLAL
jgi:site-specific DNA-methyltransferase (adenine-specific)/site-specific DNA-methyltransferase (cytosine-N4-specific)